MSQVVPFGKYKGQPVEAMAADQGYVDWLMAQPWFKDRYQNIYTLVVNNFTEPSETPEHNALQVLFLDDAFAERVVRCCYGDRLKECFRQFEYRLVDKTAIAHRRVIVRFEVRGVDVFVRWQHSKDGVYWYDTDETDFTIEIKPSVGDDYPAVLRQIRNQRLSGYPILFLGSYVGVGATKEQFVETFNRSGIKVVFRGDV